MTDLSVRVGAVSLRSPIIGASGTCGTGVELADATDFSGVGALALKTVTLEPRAGNRPVRVAETPSGMINSIGLENPGIDRFVSHYLPESLKLGVPLVGSVAGSKPEEYAECARRLSEAGGLVAIEVNLSCPNVHGGPACATPLAYGQDPSSAAEVIRAVRSATALPIWAKLTSCVTDLAAVGRACEEAGADALTAINTVPGMAVDVARSRILVRGGLSGPAILPVALRCVYDLTRAVRIPVVGCGGASTADDVIAFLMVGASAVQIGTATFRDPAAMSRIASGLSEHLEAAGVPSVDMLIGSLEAVA